MTSSVALASTPTASHAEDWMRFVDHPKVGGRVFSAEPLDSNVTLVSFIVTPKWSRPFTQTIGTDLEQSQNLAMLESAFVAWHNIGLEETWISNRVLGKALALLRPATIRETPLGKRYKSAAEELVDLLKPQIGIPTIASMCGVSDRGFRNWLDGGGIREKKSRRLMVVRALVKALVLQKGRDRAIQWLQVEHPALDMTAPLDLLCAGETNRVFELALGTRPRSRRSSIIPHVDETESEPTAQTVLAERGELPAAEIYDLL